LYEKRFVGSAVSIESDDRSTQVRLCGDEVIVQELELNIIEEKRFERSDQRS
jgi:hypothetical protein